MSRRVALAGQQRVEAEREQDTDRDLVGCAADSSEDRKEEEDQAEDRDEARFCLLLYTARLAASVTGTCAGLLPARCRLG
jgi:hypothetical protein